MVALTGLPHNDVYYCTLYCIVLDTLSVEDWPFHYTLGITCSFLRMCKCVILLHVFFYVGAKMFKDGTLEASTTNKQTYGGGFNANTGTVNLGRYQPGVNNNYGIFTVDEILFWDSALSDVDVATIP